MPKKNKYSDILKKSLEKQRDIDSSIEKKQKKLFGYRVSKEILSLIEELSTKLGIPKNQIINTAIIEYYNKMQSLIKSM